MNPLLCHMTLGFKPKAPSTAILHYYGVFFLCCEIVVVKGHVLKFTKASKSSPRTIELDQLLWHGKQVEQSFDDL